MPCLNEESLNMMDKYKTLYKEDPFAEDTITVGEQLMASMAQERPRKWLDTEQLNQRTCLKTARRHGT